MSKINNTPTSFCPNCGEVTAWEMPWDHPERNKRPCGECAKIMTDFIVADEKLARSEDSGYELSRKEKFDAERDQRRASEKLRARRRIMANARLTLTQNN